MTTKKILQQSTDLVERIADYIRSQNVLTTGDGVVVAVSGGSDSLALLHIMAALDLSLQLTAVYIDHGLRPLEIPREKSLIEQYSQQLTTPFIVESIDVRKFAKDEKRSIEDAGRILRYQQLEKIRQKRRAKFIAVAHTADDQIEEFFIRVIRGGSRKSLCGMSFRNNNIIRPLLYEPKTVLIDYLKKRGITWSVDSSNLDKSFLRNRIRLQLLPLLERQFNPGLRKTLSGTMNILASEEDYLQEKSFKAYKKCVVVNRETAGNRQLQLTIDNRLFLEYHPALQRRVLEKSFWAMSIRPTYQQIDSLIRLIKNPAVAKELHLSDGVRAEKYSHKLVLHRLLYNGQSGHNKYKTPLKNRVIDSPGIYHIDEIKRTLTLAVMDFGFGELKKKILYLDFEKISFPVTFRHYRNGERFTPYGNKGRKKISRYLSDKKISRRARSQTPVLVSAGKIIALPGLEIDDNFKITPTTQTVLTIEWIDPSP